MILIALKNPHPPSTEPSIAISKMAGPSRKKRKSSIPPPMASSSKKSRHTKHEFSSASSVHGGDDDTTNESSQPILKAAFDPETTHPHVRSSLLAQPSQPPQPLRTRDGLVEIKLPPAKDIWDVFGDANPTTRLGSTTSLAQYQKPRRGFQRRTSRLLV